MKSDSDSSDRSLSQDAGLSFPTTLPERVEDANLLFGVMAIQGDLISAQHFADACASLLQQPGRNLGDVLMQDKVIDATTRDRIQVEVDQHVRDRHFRAKTAKNETLDELEQTLPSTGPPATTDVPDLGDQLKSSRLSLRFIHGTGGIGRVWMARDRAIGRDIALKELRPERLSNKVQRARFLREVQITAQLQHPGTVPVYDFNAGDEDGRIYYTMKFLRGQTLSEVVHDYHTRRRDSTAGIGEFLELLNIFDTVCDTLSYAHSRGIIHRDLKGENVVVGEYGEVVVIDWGLAKRIGEAESDLDDLDDLDEPDALGASDGLQTIHGAAMGTPAFMAPEQALGEVEKFDERTDVYGLAAILYEILTGLPPFVGRDVPAILLAVCTAPPNAPRRLNPNVPPELEAICLKGLSKRQSDRHQSAAELASAVKEWVTDQARRSQTEREREQFFRMSLDALATVDSDARFKQVNPAFVALFGWSAEEIVKMTAFDILHVADMVDPKATFKRVLDGENLAGLERRCLCKDGSFRWVQWHLTRLPGTPLVYAVGRDITPQKQQQQAFQNLLDTTPDAMVVTNTDRTIRIVNTRTESLFGYGRDELIGQTLEVLIPDRFRETHPDDFAAYVANPQARPLNSELELMGRHKDGSEIPVRISLTPFPTDEGLMISSVIRPGWKSAAP
jgi:PAS domain S-box-containing protein